MAENQTDKRRRKLSPGLERFRHLPVELLAVLTELSLPARRIMALAPGQSVPLDVDAGNTVELRARGVGLAVAEVRVRDGERCARVVMLQRSNEEGHATE